MGQDAERRGAICINSSARSGVCDWASGDHDRAVMGFARIPLTRMEFRRIPLHRVRFHLSLARLAPDGTKLKIECALLLYFVDGTRSVPTTFAG